MTSDALDQLLPSLRCPVSKQPLVLHQQRLVSLDPETRLSYPIRDRIPVLLAEEAVTLDAEQWHEITKRGSAQL
ncbi:MAG TPA: hypothetical protein EYN86_02990 [Planctomycetes bacterium]|jgi:uncharacterized protein YbaR (Trm112 family)|nr:hypothetical protein [Planctomycetota bacterium]